MSVVEEVRHWDEISFENAVDKIWPLEGYLLKEKLHRDSLTDPAL